MPLYFSDDYTKHGQWNLNLTAISKPLFKDLREGVASEHSTHFVYCKIIQVVEPLPELSTCD